MCEFVYLQTPSDYIFAKVHFIELRVTWWTSASLVYTMHGSVSLYACICRTATSIFTQSNFIFMIYCHLWQDVMLQSEGMTIKWLVNTNVDNWNWKLFLTWYQFISTMLTLIENFKSLRVKSLLNAPVLDGQILVNHCLYINAGMPGVYTTFEWNTFWLNPVVNLLFLLSYFLLIWSPKSSWLSINIPRSFSLLDFISSFVSLFNEYELTLLAFIFCRCGTEHFLLLNANFLSSNQSMTIRISFPFVDPARLPVMRLLCIVCCELSNLADH